jgi:phage protein D
MANDNLHVEIGGGEVGGLYDDLVRLEVELDDQLAGMFRLTLGLLLGPDGTWPYLDDERFAIWQPATITAGVEDDSPTLIDGFITHVRPEFGDGLDQCRLEVWGMDASVLMDRADKLKAWPSRKDSDIAAEVFQTYGITPDVTDTQVVHDEEQSTIIQRETDIQFLTRLALRNGFECFVDADGGHFRPPAVDDSPQPVLAVQFGDDTNVNRFSLEVNALAQSNVAMSQVDHVSGEVHDVTVETGRQKSLGSTPASGFLGPGMDPAVVYIGRSVTTGDKEMTELCQGLFDLGEWFVTGEGEVSANKYGGVLTPRSTVTIKGLGETHSGVYYVTHVTHTFIPDGYTQTFRVKRNALRPNGDEDFSADGGGLLAGLGGLL